MSRRKVLVPYNFTRYDQQALDFVTHRFAQEKEDVEVTLFHAYTPIPEIQVRGNPIMEKMSANLNYLRQQLKEKEEALKAARDRLVAGGVPSGQVQHVFKALKRDVAQEIVTHVRDNRIDMVVLSRTPEGITSFFKSSVSDKVTKALKDTAVFVVS